MKNHGRYFETEPRQSTGEVKGRTRQSDICLESRQHIPGLFTPLAKYGV